MRFRLELGFLGEALLGIGLDFGDLGREIARGEIKEEVVIVDMEAISVDIDPVRPSVYNFLFYGLNSVPLLVHLVKIDPLLLNCIKLALN